MLHLGLVCTLPSLMAQVVKNRRLAAMQRLQGEGVFFSEEEMRRRAPLLYEQLVRRFGLPAGAESGRD